LHRPGGFGSFGVGPDLSRYDDLPVRQAEGVRSARSARGTMGRHAGGAQCSPARGVPSRFARNAGMITSAIIPRPLARLPWRLIFLVAAIAGFGLVVLYSA